MSSRCLTSRCVFIASFWISSLRRSCLVGVDVSCSGFIEAGSMRSLGLLSMANSIGVLPLRVTCFSPLPPCASSGQVWSVVEWSGPDFWRPRVPRKTSWTIVHPSQLDLAKECEILWEFSSNYAFYRMPACHEDHLNPYLHKSPSGSSGKCTSIHGVWKWLLMERYTYMDMLLNVMWLHRKQSETERFYLQLLSNRDPKR